MSLQSFNVRANSIPIAKKSLRNQSTDLDDRSVDRGPIQSARGAIQREGRASSSSRDSKVSAETWSLHFLSSPGHRGMFLWPSSHPKSARILSPGRCRRYTCRFSFSFFLFFFCEPLLRTSVFLHARILLHLPTREGKFLEIRPPVSRSKSAGMKI